jgi:hypothetical protein
MQASEVPRAVAAARSIASSLDLTVDDDAIVLQDSNKLTLRLLPCDVLARVAPVAHQVAQFEIESLSGSPNPGARWLLLSREWSHASTSVMASWSRCGPTTNPRRLERSHQPTTPMRSSGCMPACASSMSRRRTSRIESSRLNNSWRSRDRTPALADADRELLGDTLRSLRRAIGERGAAEQLLHGEPHPGNLLTTKNGLLFIDLETCCRGPVEFDLAHAPEEVSEHYPGIDQDLLRECRILVLAMITTWRWDRDDQLPNGRQLGAEWLSQIRAALDRNGLDTPSADREAERRLVAATTAAAPGSRRGRVGARERAHIGSWRCSAGCPRPPRGRAPRPGRCRRAGQRQGAAARRPGPAGAELEVDRGAVEALSKLNVVSARPYRVTCRVTSWLDSTQVAGAPTGVRGERASMHSRISRGVPGAAEEVEVERGVQLVGAQVAGEPLGSGSQTSPISTGAGPYESATRRQAR